MPKKVIIIGGGIAGLSTAYLLKKEGIKSIVLEQADRLGGRIFTKEIDGLRFELGATWVFEDPYLKRLIQELGLELYPQYLKGDGLIKYSPEMLTQKSSTEVLMNGAVYHKVKGGTGEIIHALAKELESSCVHLNARVTALDFENIAVKVSLADGSALEADRVILALPPKSIAENIGITPIFDRDGLLKTTQTWMGESAKFTAFFDRDYWREQKLSGFVYSNFGLIREMQDHQSPDGKSFGLVGFVKAVGELGSDFDKRKRAFLTEIEDLFGIREESCLGYDDFLWVDHFRDSQGENYNSNLLPHQNNGHPFFSQAHFEGRLLFAGAETSPTNPGYMEGAIRSAYHTIGLLRKV